ncbi:MAG: ATP-binding protein [Acidobacteriota bacterium]
MTEQRPLTTDIELIVYQGSQEISRVPWTGSRLRIGRRPRVEIRTQEPTMSGVHAEIVPGADGSGLQLRDLQSLNGTHLNGQFVTEAPLQIDDRIQIGRSTIVIAARTRIPPPNSLVDESGEETWSDHSGQTVKIHLESLRGAPGTEMEEEDERILLLRDLFETLKSMENQGKILASVRLILQRAFPTARIFILQPQEDDDWQDPLVAEKRPSLTFVTQVARSNSAILSTALPKDERFSFADSIRLSGIQTAIAAPTSCEGVAVAVLYVDRLGLPAFTKRDLNLLGIAANHVSAVLENASRIQTLRRTNAELEHARIQLAELNRNLEGLVEARTHEVRRQAEEISQLAEAKDELLGIAAHDIRGPLTVIQGTAELLQMQTREREDELLSRSLGVIVEATQGLSTLLSELLDAKSIESGKIHIDARQVDVVRLFDEATPVARLAAERRGIQVEIEAENDLLVHVDPRRVGQALTNLLLNAIKFSKPGTRILLSGYRCRTTGGAEIQVEDQGIGIPPEELKRLFRPFEQGRAGKQVGGSGLGLMIAKRIVELHGGELTVQSKVGVGTRFSLLLPASPTAADA